MITISLPACGPRSATSTIRGTHHDDPQWGYLQTAAVHEQNFPTVENKLDGPGISMVARLTNTISPSLLNEFVVSYVNSHITLNDVSGPGGHAGLTVSEKREHHRYWLHFQ